MWFRGSNNSSPTVILSGIKESHHDRSLKPIKWRPKHRVEEKVSRNFKHELLLNSLKHEVHLNNI
jgi:hypothetical protein